MKRLGPNARDWLSALVDGFGVVLSAALLVAGATLLWLFALGAL